MRKLLTLLLLGALFAVTVLPDEHPAHRTVEEAVETVWKAGEKAVRVASEALSDLSAREGNEGAGDGPRSEDRGGQREGREGPFVAGRAALTDRLSARIDRRADRVAQAAPASVERSVDALAAHLKKHAGPTMRGRTRAAFRWVADHIAYDTGLTKQERMVRDTQSPATVLRTREAVCEGYARLFVALAKEMGLEAAFIVGEANPVGPGGDGRHAWVAVRLADGWYLLDPTWAAGHVSQGRFISRFDEEWWLVEPERMWRTHRPDDSRWALGAPASPRKTLSSTAAAKSPAS